MEKSRSTERGFSLVEAIVALGILASGLIALAQLFAIATDANRGARTTTMAALLAEQKMEQLRSLTWGYDPLGLPFSDFATDLSVVPARSTGGTGLSASPVNSLSANVPGYVDYLDQYGTWVGTGANPPAGTVYIRRWAIQPVPTNPNNTLVLQVVVTRAAGSAAGTAASGSRAPNSARLVSVKARKSI